MHGSCEPGEPAAGLVATLRHATATVEPRRGRRFKPSNREPDRPSHPAFFNGKLPVSAGSSLLMVMPRMVLPSASGTDITPVSR